MGIHSIAQPFSSVPKVASWVSTVKSCQHLSNVAFGVSGMDQPSLSTTPPLANSVLLFVGKIGCPSTELPCTEKVIKDS